MTEDDVQCITASVQAHIYTQSWLLNADHLFTNPLKKQGEPGLVSTDRNICWKWQPCLFTCQLMCFDILHCGKALQCVLEQQKLASMVKTIITVVSHTQFIYAISERSCVRQEYLLSVLKRISTKITHQNLCVCVCGGGGTPTSSRPGKPGFSPF